MKYIILLALAFTLSCSSLQSTATIKPLKKQDVVIKKKPVIKVIKLEKEKKIVDKLTELIENYSVENKSIILKSKIKEGDKKGGFLKYQLKKLDGKKIIQIDFKILHLRKRGVRYHINIITEKFNDSGDLASRETIKINTPDKDELLKQLKVALREIL